MGKKCSPLIFWPPLMSSLVSRSFCEDMAGTYFLPGILKVDTRFGNGGARYVEVGKSIRCQFTKALSTEKMSSLGRRKRSHDEDDSSSDSDTAPWRSGRAPVPSEKRRALSNSPPPALRRAKKTKAAAPPSESPQTAINSENPSSPTPLSVASTTPAEVPQPTTLKKKERSSTAAHDINAFFTRGKGEKTVCVRCK